MASVAKRPPIGKQLNEEKSGWRVGARLRACAVGQWQLGRMRQPVDFDELLDVDACVNLGGIQPGVAEHLLDVTQIRAFLQHQGGHRVPKQVAVQKGAVE